MHDAFLQVHVPSLELRITYQEESVSSVQEAELSAATTRFSFGQSSYSTENDVMKHFVTTLSVENPRSFGLFFLARYLVLPVWV